VDAAAYKTFGRFSGKLQVNVDWIFSGFRREILWGNTVEKITKKALYLQKQNAKMELN